jgi:hypothetical protein
MREVERDDRVVGDEDLVGIAEQVELAGVLLNLEGVLRRRELAPLGEGDVGDGDV